MELYRCICPLLASMEVYQQQCRFTNCSAEGSKGSRSREEPLRRVPCFIRENLPVSRLSANVER